MKTDTYSDMERLYDQALSFLEDQGFPGKPVPGPSRIEYQDTFRTAPEKYFLKDNLLLLLKES